LPLGPIAAKALLHGHCHQKSFGAFKPVEKILRLVPDLAVETIESSCCGMAGAFGYGADTYQTSMEMAELTLLPAVRRADAATLIVADGTSCRHQIKDGADRQAIHVARVLAMSLDSARIATSPSSQPKESAHG
jgi:Fe-S oxidoreductase